MQKTMMLFSLLFFSAGAVQADTIYLKGGREVQGTFTGFEDGRFMITDSDGNQLKYRMNRVERVVIDRDGRWRGDDFRRSQRAQWESYDPFDVRPGSAWVESPVRVYNGQRFRVEASGTVTLGTRSNVNPEGLSGQRVRNLPMPNQNVGALIARIGSRTDSPPLYIGRSKEIVADRDGILYFAVNYPRTSNVRGAFVVDVALNRGTDAWTGRSQGIEKTITINGNQPWTDTGIDIDPDMAVEIVSEGQITYDSRTYVGPDGSRSVRQENYPVRDVGVGAVIAKIRYPDGYESSPIFIGSRNSAATQEGEHGRLFIGVNDDEFGDNTGSYRVAIRNVSVDRDTSYWPDRSSRAVAGGEKAITVYADQPWTDTGIDLTPNSVAEITAEGQIAYSKSGNAGPGGGLNLLFNNYPVTTAGVGALIAKIQYPDGYESDPVFIGASNKINTGQDKYGRLFIGVNDDNFGDNKGSYRVIIRFQ